ncbi:unnamed protein product [Spirodela intermedia]|uniref:Uncharacterized protein n=1 Tax=Spirodela intermedia TaxID=51605 RepID=A0A7I8JHV5_SPIIN|nr:unnamed protein product [Spirodela intermedia]CAA6669718.1 unnamed protein product [Spirodela intermedia]
MCETPAVNGEQRKDERPPAVDDLVGWRDFPKGLRVLLHEGGSSSSDIKSKLERMEYSVSLFGNEREALEAVACKSESFHVAIVEVTAANSDSCFRFLETARGLPTIMISDAECIETMMRCIALGAAEFLQKPVSEEKLKNIWQHVVHKAFNAGGGAAISKSLKPVKETVSSMLQLRPGEDSGSRRRHRRRRRRNPRRPLEQFSRSAPSDLSKTCNKSVDETCNNSTGEEDDGEKEISAPPSCPSDEGDVEDPTKSADAALQRSPPPSGSRASKKRMKVDWTPDLHRRFVQAVEQLGIDQAIPSKILELMRVEGLTRHNVASHLQKYRMRKRHALPKDDARGWQRAANPPPPARACQYRPLVAFAGPSGYTGSHVYPVWGHPHAAAAAVQPWPTAAAAGFPSWQPPAAAAGFPPWQPPPNACRCMGCPVVHQSPYAAAAATPISPQYTTQPASRRPCAAEEQEDDVGLAEELIDEVVREALREPWRPLPLGLKPPSTESVLAELHRQGIHRVPPR